MRALIEVVGRHVNVPPWPDGHAPEIVPSAQVDLSLVKLELSPVDVGDVFDVVLRVRVTAILSPG